ncbi:hypothetical protein CW745_10995 [Psychromonas sp. psych-6C06]|uniref:GGDEF domain-containing protein n=1 Tax=Psychromonas sp. psych-6C06 TaxID=2058089 RepID=UPI000C32B359|nr:GGDEF domain-containing protein [Psychromonas sp. psych-6C06]PKF61830.1 hypothetical protein CW745_10995 [Psychromonas sp. psych-6C06]
MKAKFKDRLSIKVVSLTIIMSLMTLLASLVGITSLNEFKTEYQEVKNQNFDLLLKMTELKAQTDGLIHISTEMLLTETLNELQWDMLEVSDKRLWVDKLFKQLTGHTNNHQELLILKLRLYSHIDEIFRIVSNKFKFSEIYFQRYADVEELKKESLKRGDLAFYSILDRALIQANPIANQSINADRESSRRELQDYIDNISTDINENELQYLKSLFLGEQSLAASYQNYAQQKQLIEALRLKNEEFSDLFVSFVGENVTRIQDRFVVKLTKIENKLKARKQRLYLVVFCCLFVTIFLVLIQLDFIRRIELVRKVINAGETHRKMSFPIEGKDEISRMARAVKSYIERLVIKEQEVLETNKQLEHLASRDSLTAIYNRRYFETFLTKENSRYTRYKELYCLAMIDLDFFKLINDNYGHDAGDKVLVEFTQRVLKVIRNTDIFARYGGEEFVILMPNTTQSNATMLMERIRLVIEKSPYLYNEIAIPFTVSIGVSEVQRISEDDPYKQLAFVDKALYEAKQKGRNRVCVYKNN